MTNRFLISAAVAALIAGTGLANAQGMNREGQSGGSTAQQSAPASEHGGAPAAAGKHEATQPAGPSSGMKATQSEEKSPNAGKNQRAEDNVPGQKSKSMSSDNDRAGGGKDMKAEGREDHNGMKAEGQDRNNMKAEGRDGRNGNMNAESKERTDSKSQTTGQAGAGAKLSGEQRTRITTVIRDQHVQPLTNVNFSISVGTRVPREVSFRPLPAEVVTFYPEWRGYEFVLVRDQILVIDPRTLEIVAILDA